MKIIYFKVDRLSPEPVRELWDMRGPRRRGNILMCHGFDHEPTHLETLALVLELEDRIYALERDGRPSAADDRPGSREARSS